MSDLHTLRSPAYDTRNSAGQVARFGRAGFWENPPQAHQEHLVAGAAIETEKLNADGELDSVPQSKGSLLTMTLTEADESRLVARAQDGDQSAFRRLTDQCLARLRGVLQRIIRDRETTDDAMQEAMTRAWLNLGRFEGRSRFCTWLTRIGINEAYSALRPSGPQTLELDDQIGERIPAWGNRPEQVFESREFLAAVDAALAALPLDYRTAVTLRDVEGLSTTEAAGILGIGERALKSRVRRGRMALRAALDSWFQSGYVN
ncbi:MAG: RNA polymerase sigma factor [Solirubrobacteraceae bacterium]